MNYSTPLLLVICLYYNDVSESVKNKSQASTTFHRISGLQSWRLIMKNTDIMIDAQFKTIYDYYDVKNTDEPYVFLISDEDVPDTLALMYTALKCKYAYLIRETLRLIFENTLRCQNDITKQSNRYKKMLEDAPIEGNNNNDKHCLNTVFDGFMKLKPYIVKIIFNLFRFIDVLSPNLKFSDKSLLKSLISVNLLLYYHSMRHGGQQLKDDESAAKSHDDLPDKKTTLPTENHYVMDHIIFEKLLIQILDSIEYFRLKNCSVKYSFFANMNIENQKYNIPNTLNEFNVQFESLLDKQLQLMHNYSNIGISDNDFNVQMYDPPFLLVNGIFEINDSFKDLPVKLRADDADWKTMYSLYESSLKSYDIKNVFEYQLFFVELIKTIFCRKIINVHNASEFDGETKRKDIEELLSSFNEYISNVLPFTYPPDSYRSLIGIRDSISANDEVCKQFYSDDSRTTIIDLTSKTANDLVNALSMDTLIGNIGRHEYFGSFRETFELFVHEANTVGDYSLLAVDAHGLQAETAIKDDYGEVRRRTCTDTTVLREHLLLYNVLRDTTRVMCSFRGQKDEFAIERCSRDNLRLAYRGVYNHVAHSLRSAVDLRTQRILLPVLVHLRNTEWLFGADGGDDDYGDDDLLERVDVKHQLLLMTLCAMEHQELAGCPSPVYNATIHREILSDRALVQHGDLTDVNVLTAIAESLNAALARKSAAYSDVAAGPRPRDRFVDKYTFAEVLAKNARGGTVYSKTMMFHWNGREKNIHGVALAVTREVIDYQNLADYQSIVLKWLVSNVYIKMFYLLRLGASALPPDVRESLQQLTRVRFPPPVDGYVADTVRAYLDIYEHNYETSTRDFSVRLNEQFHIYDMIVDHDLLYKNDHYGSLKDDIDLLIEYTNTYRFDLLVLDGNLSIIYSGFFSEK